MARDAMAGAGHMCPETMNLILKGFLVKHLITTHHSEYSWVCRALRCPVYCDCLVAGHQSIAGFEDGQTKKGAFPNTFSLGKDVLSYFTRFSVMEGLGLILNYEISFWRHYKCKLPNSHSSVPARKSTLTLTSLLSFHSLRRSSTSESEWQQAEGFMPVF